MQVICLEDKAFYELIDEVVQRLREKHSIKEDKWISGPEAMQKLRIKSKTTLQRLRDEGKIRFSQPDRKVILYDVDSINEYLDTYAKNPFLSLMEENKQYQHGFNNGYTLAKHNPTLYTNISKNMQPANDYIDGLLSGGKQYELELTKGHRIEKKHEDKDHLKDIGGRDK